MKFLTPSVEEREAIAKSLGITKCDYCLRLCPFCPRLIEARPDLAYRPEDYGATEPSFFQKVTNFGRAVTQHLAAGLPHADESTIEHRLDICHGCEHFDTIHEACRMCGCNMQVKVRWAEQRCPVNKW